MVRKVAKRRGDRRMAINYLAGPVAGLPTRFIRLSCWSDNSGMSEKSICESGVCRALFPARLSDADDADGFFFMILSPHRIHHEQDAARD